MNQGGDVPIGLVMFCVATPFLAIMVVVAIRYAAVAFQARMKMLADDRYKALAEQTATIQVETAAGLAIVKAQLADIAASLAKVEQVLKEVG